MQTEVVELSPFHPRELPAWFWAIIDRADGEDARLEAELKRLPRNLLIDFYILFEEAERELPTDVHQDILIQRGWSGEFYGDEYFGKIVGRGSDFYTEVFEDPARLPGLDEVEEWTDFKGSIMVVWYERFDQDIFEARDELRGGDLDFYYRVGPK